MQRRWTEQEVAQIIIEDLHHMALNYDLEFLARWFRLERYRLARALEREGIIYSDERKKALRLYVRINRSNKSCRQMARETERSPQKISQVMREIRAEQPQLNGMVGQ